MGPSWPGHIHTKPTATPPGQQLGVQRHTVMEPHWCPIRTLNMAEDTGGERNVFLAYLHLPHGRTHVHTRDHTACTHTCVCTHTVEKICLQAGPGLPWWPGWPVWEALLRQKIREETPPSQQKEEELGELPAWPLGTLSTRLCPSRLAPARPQSPHISNPSLALCTGEPTQAGCWDSSVAAAQVPVKNQHPRSSIISVSITRHRPTSRPRPNDAPPPMARWYRLSARICPP